MREEIQDAVRNYANRVQSYSDQFSKWSETEIKRYLIEPLLTSLNWDPADPNFVRHEFSVTMGTEVKKVDYALMSGDTVICVVEAKSGGLDESAARQALSYAQSLKAPWALVTNGQRLCLYGTEFYSSQNVKNALVMDINILQDENSAFLDYLIYLSNGMLDSKEVYQSFKTYNERSVLLAFLQGKKDILIKEIIKWIEENWDKGTVDETSIINCLETIFGKDDTIKEKPVQKAHLTTKKTVASDWKLRNDLGEGVFELKDDPSKRIDVSLSGPDVRSQLEKIGLRLSSPTAFGGFYYNLRLTAGLIQGK